MSSPSTLVRSVRWGCSRVNRTICKGRCSIALILKLLGRRQAALECFDRAIALDVRNAVAYHCRAGMYNELGRTGDALANYDQPVALNPRFVDAFYGRGEVLQQSGRLLDAIASYDQASRIKP